MNRQFAFESNRALLFEFELDLELTRFMTVRQLRFVFFLFSLWTAVTDSLFQFSNTLNSTGILYDHS